MDVDKLYRKSNQEWEDTSLPFIVAIAQHREARSREVNVPILTASVAVPMNCTKQESTERK